MRNPREIPTGSETHDPAQSLVVCPRPTCRGDVERVVWTLGDPVPDWVYRSPVVVRHNATKYQCTQWGFVAAIFTDSESV